jgi:hypothetical protein
MAGEPGNFPIRRRERCKAEPGNAVYPFSLPFCLEPPVQGLKWFVDLVQFIERFGEQMDWRSIQGIVTDANVKKFFGITLKLVSEITERPGLR